MVAELLLASLFTVQPAPAVKPHFDKADWTLLASDAAARSLDVYSTHKMLAQGDHELILPKFVAAHTPVMAAYSAGCVASDYFWARMLVKHRHPRIAKIVLAVDASQDGFFAVHNLFLKPVRGAK